MGKRIINMKVKKVIIIFIWIIFLIINISCNNIQYNISKEELKEIEEFVSKFNYDSMYNSTLFASKKLISEVYKDGKCIGKITNIESFDKKNDLYYYSKTIVEGTYYGTGIDEYDYHNKEIVYYLCEGCSSNNIFIEMIDNNYNNSLKTKEEVNGLIEKFFYTDLSSGIHHGGMYYGDYVRKNFQKYKNNFEYNNNLLSYNINTISEKNRLDVITSHYFKVNQNGLLVNLSTKTMYRLNTDTYTITTIDCDYENDIDKIFNI